MYRCDSVDAVVIVEVGKLHKEEELLNLDLILLVANCHHLAVELLGD